MFALIALASSKLWMVHEEREFLGWMRTSGRMYVGDEYHMRLGIFMANARFVSDFNRNNQKSFRVSLNHMAAMTPAEYKTITSSFATYPSKLTKQHVPRKAAPDAIDYREKGVVSDVLNQGTVESPATIVAAGTAEGYYGIEYKFQAASPEMLLTCSAGGSVEEILHYILNSGYYRGVIGLAKDFPWLGTPGGTCDFRLENDSITITELVKADGTENGLMNLVGSEGPVAVGVDAGQSSFQMYSSGIYDESKCSTTPSVDVLCVGYGEEDGAKYWILKNSWGASWGEKGYIRVARDKSNMCGVATRSLLARS